MKARLIEVGVNPDGVRGFVSVALEKLTLRIEVDSDVAKDIAKTGILYSEADATFTLKCGGVTVNLS